MSIMQKLLDLFKLPDTTDPAVTIQATSPSTYTPNPKTEQYYKREAHKKENNLNITYQDVAIYDMNPFDLKSPFISDGNFVCIALAGGSAPFYKVLTFVVNCNIMLLSNSL